MRIEISDWTDATRPMRSAVHEALQRLREAIEPPRRITEPAMLAPYHGADPDELHTQIERALDELQG